MTRRQETALDVAEYTVGGALFFIVSAVTAAVMAVGFLGITIAQRLRD